MPGKRFRKHGRSGTWEEGHRGPWSVCIVVQRSYDNPVQVTVLGHRPPNMSRPSDPYGERVFCRIYSHGEGTAENIYYAEKGQCLPLIDALLDELDELAGAIARAERYALS